MKLVELVAIPVPRCGERFESVRVLWVAVVQRAIFDYVTYKDSTTSRLDFRTAERFLFSDDGGLVDLCQVMGWPLQTMRRRAKAMTKNEVRKMDFRERTSIPESVKESEGAEHGNGQ